MRHISLPGTLTAVPQLWLHKIDAAHPRLVPCACRYFQANFRVDLLGGNADAVDATLYALNRQTGALHASRLACAQR